MRLDLAEIEQRVAAFTGKLDGEIARVLGPHSCVRGCAHCCYIAVGAGVGEAFYIAGELATWPEWRAYARALHAHALEQTREPRDDTAWFGRHVPCPFLMPENTCRIYARRPVACRAHYVRSPPENCALDAIDPVTRRYDAVEQATPHVLGLDLSLFSDYPELGEPFAGYMTHLVLWALRFHVRGGDRRWLDKRLATLPEPHEWHERDREEKFTVLPYRPTRG